MYLMAHVKPVGSTPLREGVLEECGKGGTIQNLYGDGEQSQSDRGNVAVSD